MIVNKVIVHHSGTDDGPMCSWPAIRKYHIEVNGWRDIGYHAGVEIVGTSYEVLVGRAWDRIGAHCLGQNDQSLGLCLVGNFNIETPPPEQLEVAAKLVAMWLRLFNIPDTEIYRHSVFNDTDCPGDLFDLEIFRDMVLDV